MDGVLFDSMLNHAIAWERVLTRHGFAFTQHDCFLNEGRTGMDVILSLSREQHIPITEDEAHVIYDEKSECYHQSISMNRKLTYRK